MAARRARSALRRAPRPERGDPPGKGEGDCRRRGRRRTLNLLHRAPTSSIYQLSSLAIDASPQWFPNFRSPSPPSVPDVCYRQLCVSLCRCSPLSLGLSNSSLPNPRSVFYLFLSVLPLCFLRIALLYQRCSPVLYTVVPSTEACAVGLRWECSYLLCITYFEQWQLTLCNTCNLTAIGPRLSDR